MIAALVGLWPSNIARFPILFTILLDIFHYRPHCSGFPVQHGVYRLVLLLQLPLDSTIAAFLVLGLWPPHHRPLSLLTTVLGFPYSPLDFTPARGLPLLHLL